MTGRRSTFTEALSQISFGNPGHIVDQLITERGERLVRNPAWQKEFLSKPLDERIAFGKQARNQSQEDAKDKTYEILDVNQDEVLNVFREHRVPLFIHGHTHRPDRHQINIDKSNYERIVLGDWHRQGWYLIADEAELELRSFEFPG